MGSTSTSAHGIPFGKYHLLERLGRGGMAEVWKAKALGPRGYARKLVVKRILPELVCDDEFVRMFVEEARLSASLNHRNIVQVYEFGQVGGEYYLAMEWVHGRDVNSIQRRAKESNLTPSVPLAAYVAREVCRALAYAHALTDEDGTPLRIIHRDVSPSNVMVGFDGSVKLLDFGIAKALALASESCTQVGVLKGKFGYMAPEQVDCDSDIEVDHRADLFVAGVVLWEMLTMRRLFKGSNDVKTIAMVREAHVLPPSTFNPAVPAALDAVCLGALARARTDRFDDCAAMAKALDQVVRELKFDSDCAARLMGGLFREAHDTTQIPLVPVPVIECTPSSRRPARADATEIEITDGSVQNSSDASVYTSSPKRVPSERRTWRRVLLAMAAAVAAVSVGATHRPPPPPPVTAAIAAAPEPTELLGGPWLAPPDRSAPAPSAQLAPSTVTIKVTTRPIGVAVRVVGEATPVGITPLTVTLPRDEMTARRLILAAPGYQSAQVEVMVDVDSRLHYELQRAIPVVVRRRPLWHKKPLTATARNDSATVNAAALLAGMRR